MGKFVIVNLVSGEEIAINSSNVTEVRTVSGGGGATGPCNVFLRDESCLCVAKDIHNLVYDFNYNPQLERSY